MKRQLAVAAITVGLAVLSSFGGPHKVKLMWTANQEPDLEGYRVYWTTNFYWVTNGGSVKPVVTNFQFSTNATGGKTTNAVIVIDGGVRWLFKVSAYNVIGLESELSEPAICEFDSTKLMRPGKATNVVTELWVGQQASLQQVAFDLQVALRPVQRELPAELP